MTVEFQAHKAVADYCANNGINSFRPIADLIYECFQHEGENRPRFLPYALLSDEPLFRMDIEPGTSDSMIMSGLCGTVNKSYRPTYADLGHSRKALAEYCNQMMNGIVMKWPEVIHVCYGGPLLSADRAPDMYVGTIRRPGRHPCSIHEHFQVAQRYLEQFRALTTEYEGGQA